MVVGYTLILLTKQRVGIRIITRKFLGNHAKYVLAKHYWSSRLEELRDKVLKAVEPLQNQLLEIVNKNS